MQERCIVKEKYLFSYNPTTFAMFYLGNYYNSIKKYDLMEKYYLMYLDRLAKKLLLKTHRAVTRF